MIFIAYVIVFGGYLAVTAAALLYLPMRFRQRRQRLAVFAAMLTLFVLAPGGWIYYERSYFNNLCEKEAGVRIYRRVEGVSGFVGSGGSAAEILKVLPYKYIEDEDSAGAVMRFRLAVDGTLVMERAAVAQSQYARKTEVVSLSQNAIDKIVTTIFDRRSGEVIAVLVRYGRGHNWFKPWLSSGSCPGESLATEITFIKEVLKPATDQ